MTIQEIKQNLLAKLKAAGYAEFIQKMVDQHFEGSVWKHTSDSLDAADKYEGPYKVEMVIATGLHDIGKNKQTQKVDAAKGTITYHGHAEAGYEIIDSYLPEGEYNRPLVKQLVRHHDIIWQMKAEDVTKGESAKMVLKIREAIAAIAATLAETPEAKRTEVAAKLLLDISVLDEAGNTCTAEKTAKKEATRKLYCEYFKVA